MATDYRNTVERVFSLYNQLEIAHKRQKTDLALQNVKAILAHIGKFPKVVTQTNLNQLRKIWGFG
ncbi:hypothetical protein [Nodularia chucula]|uniref:hypothetical protein n=1 Tax=Nodularia chucula TaxID=3093667 RepID=UPI0039C5CE5C